MGFVYLWINVLRNTDEINPVAIIINYKIKLSGSYYVWVSKVRDISVSIIVSKRLEIFIK